VRRAPLTALALVAGTTGCGDPYATPSPEPAPPPGAQPAKAVAPPQQRGLPEPTPESAARRAAELAGNWTGETIEQRYSELARRTTGVARAQAEQTAAAARTDRQLAAPGARSIAIVHAITTRGTGARRRLLVVTHETLVTDGVRSVRWRVTVAEARRSAGGWVIARWEPQP
jgi:hypothetical protein